MTVGLRTVAPLWQLRVGLMQHTEAALAAPGSLVLQPHAHFTPQLRVTSVICDQKRQLVHPPMLFNLRVLLKRYSNPSLPSPLHEYPAHLFYSPRSSSLNAKIKWHLPSRLSQRYFTLVSLILSGLGECLSCPSTVALHNTALLLRTFLSG